MRRLPQLGLLLLTSLLAVGCDSPEVGTIEIKVDKKTLERDILQPPGMEISPESAKKAASAITGTEAEAPVKKK